MHAIYTISRLVEVIWHLLQSYSAVEVKELHAVWDFKSWFAPHVTQFGGFATGQFGDGMHEFLVRKDRAGVVRIHF
eukprot:5929025-Pleurochrysis_carterae.AAC.1